MRISTFFAFVLALFAMPAQAATIVGESDGGYHYDAFDLDLTASGDYLVSIMFDAPVTNLYFAIEFEEFFDEYTIEDGSWFGGNDFTYYSQFSPEGPLTEGAFTFSFDASYDYKANGFRYVGFTNVLGGEIEFDSASSTGYRISISQIGAVPEPATWAFLIFGFGAIGGAMRARKRAAARIAFA